MACGSIANCYLRGCDIGSSGIKKLHFGNYSAATWTEDSEGKITGCTANTTFYPFEVKEETASFTENVIASATGNVSFEQLVEMVFLLNRQEVRNRVEELTSGVSQIIVQDENDQYWLVGRVRGCSPNGGTGARGVAAGDENSFRLTFRTLEGTPASEIDINGTYSNTLIASC